MKKYIQKKYALSDDGTKDVIHAIISSTLLNLSYMAPIVFSFIFLKQNINIIFKNHELNRLGVWHSILIAIVIFIAMYIFTRIDYHFSLINVYNESARSRIHLAEALKKLPLAYFDKKDIADLSATMMADAKVFEDVFTRSVPKAYAAGITILIMSIMTLTLDWKFSIALFWVILPAYLMFRLAKKQNEKLLKEGFDLNREIINQFQESLDLVQEIKAFNREDSFIDQINQMFEGEINYKLKSELTISSVLNISYILLRLGMATVAIYGAYQFIDLRIDLFTYLSFIIISGIIFNPMNTALENISMMMYLDSVVERIREINNMPFQEGCSTFQPTNYNIVFDQVTFSYEEDVNVLKEVSFKAKQGEVTALVGPSGSGKTTAAKLAARFWDINSGRITIGGIDIAGIAPEALLKEFSIVFQDVSLFNSSVMDNIRLGRSNASDQEVKEAARVARCDDFIHKLPAGYNTLIGENGTKLSGGERQRISIARALLKDAPIILLDESTASLDAENESKIQAGISALIKDKTVIIIAHRMRTVIDADHIVVLKDGKVVESGQSSALMNRNGVFSEMYLAQCE